MCLSPVLGHMHRCLCDSERANTSLPKTSGLLSWLILRCTKSSWTSCSPYRPSARLSWNAHGNAFYCPLLSLWLFLPVCLFPAQSFSFCSLVPAPARACTVCIAMQYMSLMQERHAVWCIQLWIHAARGICAQHPDCPVQSSPFSVLNCSQVMLRQQQR